MAENYIGNEQVTGSRGSNHGVVNLESGKWEIDDVAVNVSAANLNRPVLLTIPLPFTLDVRGGPNSDGVLVGVLNNSAAQNCYTEDNSAGTFSNETADAVDAGAADVTLPDPFDTDDAIYVGRSVKFATVKSVISTAGAGDAVTSEIAWEYYNGSTWEALTLVQDDSAGFTTGASTYYTTFLPPDDWAPVVVSTSSSQYYVRMRATADDIWNTTQPVLTQFLAMQPAVSTGSIPIPISGNISSAFLMANTNSGSNNDTILLLSHNDSNGVVTYEQVTWTKNDPMDIVTGLDLDLVAGGFLGVQVLQEDGTTEFANGSMILQIDVD